MAWQSEQNLYPQYDVESFIKGVRACANGENPPGNLSGIEMYELTQEVEFQAHRKNMQENLLKSEAFLESIAKKPEIICVLPKLVYYETLFPGTDDLVEIPPKFHYSVHLLDGKVLYDTHELDDPQPVCLDAVIPGFTQGVKGMKKGERRRLFIHPSQAFRTMHWTIPPNSLLIIDVEL
jgi:peptidylprolyl isomerase